MTKRDVFVVAGTGLGMVTAGAVWLWGAIPLIVVGVAVIAAAFFIEF